MYPRSTRRSGLRAYRWPPSLDTIYQWAKILAAVAIPAFVGLYGAILTRNAQDKGLRREYVQFAVGLLQNADNHPVVRSWAIRLLDENAPTPLSPDLVRRLESGSAVLAAARNTEVEVEKFSFADIDTSIVPNGIVPAAPYLFDHGISVENMGPTGAELRVRSSHDFYGGQAVRVETSKNVLTQEGTGNASASFTLVFSQRVQSVTITRAALFAASPSGITHPAWTARALDAKGVEIQFVGEPLLRELGEVPSQSFVLNSRSGVDIHAVRIESDPRLDGRPFAAFSAVMIQQIAIARRVE